MLGLFPALSLRPEQDLCLPHAVSSQGLWSVGRCVSTPCFGGEIFYDSLQRSCSKSKHLDSLYPCPFSPLRQWPCPLSLTLFNTPALQTALHLFYISMVPATRIACVEATYGCSPGTQMGQGSHRVMVSLIRQCGVLWQGSDGNRKHFLQSLSQQMLNPKAWSLRLWPH